MFCRNLPGTYRKSESSNSAYSARRPSCSVPRLVAWPVTSPCSRTMQHSGEIFQSCSNCNLIGGRRHPDITIYSSGQQTRSYLPKGQHCSPLRQYRPRLLHGPAEWKLNVHLTLLLSAGVSGFGAQSSTPLQQAVVGSWVVSGEALHHSAPNPAGLLSIIRKEAADSLFGIRHHPGRPTCTGKGRDGLSIFYNYSQSCTHPWGLGG